MRPWVPTVLYGLWAGLFVLTVTVAARLGSNARRVKALERRCHPPVSATTGTGRYATRDELVELLASKAHEGWMAAKQADGITSRLSEWGEEFMVPYPELSERAKDIDRAAVRSVVDGLVALGAPVDTLVVIAPDLAAYRRGSQ